MPKKNTPAIYQKYIACTQFLYRETWKGILQFNIPVSKSVYYSLASFTDPGIHLLQIKVCC